MGQEGRLGTRCAQERQHPQRAAPAAEAGTCAHTATFSLGVVRDEGKTAREDAVGACHGNCRLLASGGEGLVTLGDAQAVECVVRGSCWSALHGACSMQWCPLSENLYNRIEFVRCRSSWRQEPASCHNVAQDV